MDNILLVERLSPMDDFIHQKFIPESAALERALKDRQIELEETWHRLNDQNSESDLDLDISTNNNNNKYNLLDDNKHQEHCDE
ncbi:hypothetical protein Bhyg_09390, partial [Pseudolycoriella hygida]